MPSITEYISFAYNYLYGLLPHKLMIQAPSNNPGITFINEKEINEMVTWQLISEACEIALASVSDHHNANYPRSIESKTVAFLPDNAGILVNSPIFIGPYVLKSLQTVDSPDHKINTLASKIATNFQFNATQSPVLPNLNSQILLFDPMTGILKTIVQGTRIMKLRTTGETIVATKYLYYDRISENVLYHKKILAIIGCGSQGRQHAIGMLEHYKFVEIRLWNRTLKAAEDFKCQLESLVCGSKNEGIAVRVCESAEVCVIEADIIVTATLSSEPILYSTMLKKSNCHINVIGSLFGELSQELYQKGIVYVDSLAATGEEFKKRNIEVRGKIGDVIAKHQPPPDAPLTIFHSAGLSIADAVIAQAVSEIYMSK